MAIHNQLILNHRRSHGDPVIPAAEVYIRRTIYKQMVLPGDKRPNFPPYPSVNSNVHHHRSGDLILVQRNVGVRRHRDRVAVQKRRPNGGVFVSLIGRRKQGGKGDLLAVVGGVDVHFVIVNADSIVGVPGGEGDLEGGGEGGAAGEVEGVDGGVLEDEMWLGGAEDEPDEEDEEEDEDDEAEDDREDAEVKLFPAVVFVAALLRRHGEGGGGGCGRDRN
ncbi:hypothetical protein ACS0TY_020119 [Phlomoides rotata]